MSPMRGPVAIALACCYVLSCLVATQAFLAPPAARKSLHHGGKAYQSLVVGMVLVVVG